MKNKVTLASLQRDLAAGRTTRVALTRDYLDRIRVSNERHGASFIRVYESQALREAASSDMWRAAGDVPSALAGIPISVKDLFDVAGDVTTAGSIVLKDNAPAVSDALIVQRLRVAGAVIVGRTNMTEFAYSVLGLNPHYGTPANPYDATRIPGGSSSGAATAVAYDLCAASIGTDTAGSVRVPAAFCGLVGFKPTQRRVPLEGTFPLSSSLDSIGPLANSVACCALLDSIMAGTTPVAIENISVRGLKLGISERRWGATLDDVVGRAYERALGLLSAAGAELIEVDLPALDIIEQMDSLGGMAGPEAYAVHRKRMPANTNYDPRVRTRIELSVKVSAADYIDARRLRDAAIASCNRTTEPLDALLTPTAPVVPPRFDELEAEEDYRRINMMIRRPPAAINVLDRCALTLPCHRTGELPVGLTIVGETNADEQLLAMGAGIAAALTFD